MSDFGEIIASFSDPAGAVIVQHGRAPLTKGRPGPPQATLIAVTDVGHHPEAEGNATVPGAAFVDNRERRCFYFRQEVLPAVTGDDGTSPWWVVSNGKRWVVDRVDDFSGGGFFVAHATRISQDAATTPVWFGVDTTVDPEVDVAGQTDLIAAQLIANGIVDPGLAGEAAAAVVGGAGTNATELAAFLELYADSVLSPGSDDALFDAVEQAAVVAAFDAAYPAVVVDPEPLFDPAVPQAFAPGRACRFVLESTEEDIFVAWPATAEGVTGAAFKAVDATGETIDLTPVSLDTITVDDVDYIVAVLPAHTAPDGAMHYEVL